MENPNCEVIIFTISTVRFRGYVKLCKKVMRASMFAHWGMCATHHCFCVRWAPFKGHAFVQAQMMQLAEAWLLLEARPRWHTYRKPWLLGHTLYRLHKGSVPVCCLVHKGCGVHTVDTVFVSSLFYVKSWNDEFISGKYLIWIQGWPFWSENR